MSSEEDKRKRGLDLWEPRKPERRIINIFGLPQFNPMAAFRDPDPFHSEVSEGEEEEWKPLSTSTLKSELLPTSSLACLTSRINSGPPPRLKNQGTTGARLFQAAVGASVRPLKRKKIQKKPKPTSFLSIHNSTPPDPKQLAQVKRASSNMTIYSDHRPDSPLLLQTLSPAPAAPEPVPSRSSPVIKPRKTSSSRSTLSPSPSTSPEPLSSRSPSVRKPRNTSSSRSNQLTGPTMRLLRSCSRNSTPTTGSSSHRPIELLESDEELDATNEAAKEEQTIGTKLESSFDGIPPGSPAGSKDVLVCTRFEVGKFKREAPGFEIRLQLGTNQLRPVVSPSESADVEVDDASVPWIKAAEVTKVWWNIKFAPYFLAFSLSEDSAAGKILYGLSKQSQDKPNRPRKVPRTNDPPTFFLFVKQQNILAAGPRLFSMLKSKVEMLEREEDLKNLHKESYERYYFNKPAELPQEKELLVYPPGDPHAILLTKPDLKCLKQGEYLNDSIINFYLKYIEKEKFCEEAKRCFFYNTFFFTRYITLKTGAYEGVKKWTKGVNIFERDFLFIPINQYMHWSLVIVCFPGLFQGRSNQAQSPKQAKVDGHEARPKRRESQCRKVLKVFLPQKSASTSDSCDSDEEKVSEATAQDNSRKTGGGEPAMLYLDSLLPESCSKTAFKNIRTKISGYLDKEWEHGTTKLNTLNTSFSELPFRILQVPQQENGCDCGVFLLHYVELFVKQPLHYSNEHQQDWFDISVIQEKRPQLKKLINDCVQAALKSKN
eukprot:gb/GEZN01002042.1/.p1 GENE.gb/GEZN01002042.1/~~gb/GEZN01002042.1/.p1  ORF type:complete len:771 (-),score=117.34 gb/GEZN01002042.1/:183-2495(-)